MRRLVIVTSIVSALAVGCSGGGGGSTTSPSSSTSSGSTSSGSGATSGSSSSSTTAAFPMSLAASNEVPPISGSEANVTGSGTITFHLTKDAGGNVTAATVDFQFTGNGFPAGAVVTAAHIHPGAAGTNGTILVNTGLNSGEAGVSNGSASFTKNGINVDAATAAAIVNNPGNYYFNVHTTANPNGVTRSQLNGSNASSGGGDNNLPQGPVY